MTTPIFPAPSPDPGAGRLAPTIDAIVGGDFSRSRLAALSDLSRSETTYLRQQWKTIPPTERHALLLALAELGLESIEFNFDRVFRIALNDPDAVIRELAVRDLWEDNGSDLPTVFVEMIRNDPSDDVRAAAVDALATVIEQAEREHRPTVETGSVVEMLSALISDPAESPIVRRRALGSIAIFDEDPRIAELIRAAFDDDDQTIVAGAIFAMGRTASVRWIPELMESMRSEDAELRFEAARAAGALEDEDLVPDLADLIYDPDREVRTAALQALGEIGGAAAIRILRQAEEDDEFEDPEIVDDALDTALTTTEPLEGHA